MDNNINLAIQNFINLVQEFANHKDFSTSGNKIFKQKQKMLIEFSKSIHSLHVCLYVLETIEEPTISYFASQFIKDKLKFQFQQLSQADISSTHTKIINIIKKNRNCAKIVTSNLALCLCFLYIHYCKNLGTIVNFFQQTFQMGTQDNQLSPTIYYQYLFKYLDGLLCQIDSKRLVIDEVKRTQALAIFQSQQTQILSVLHEIYNNLGSPTSVARLSTIDKENLLFAFSQWLRIKEQIPPNIAQQIHNHSVLRLALQSLDDQILSEAATQSLLTVFDIAKNPQVTPKFYQFIGSYIKVLISNANKKIANDQYQEAENYIRILCYYGRHAGKKLVDNWNTVSQQFVSSMLNYTSNEFLQVFSHLSDFWQMLIHFMTNKDPQSTLSIQISRIIVGKLYAIYCQRIKYGPTQVYELNQISQNQLAKLHKAAEDIQDRREFSRTIFQCIAVYLGQQNFVGQVIRVISELKREDSQYWGTFQSYLYSLRDIVASFPTPTQKLCQLLLIMQNINEKIVIVLKSALRIYQRLVAIQQKNSQFILKILAHTIKLFGQPLLSERAGEVFQKCCQQNSSILTNHLGELYQLVAQYPNNDSILLGLISLCKENPQNLSSFLANILNSNLEELKKAENKKKQRACIDKLLTVIETIPKGKTANLNSIIQNLLNQMWPIISQIILAPQSPEKDKDKLIEKAVKFLKLVMRSIPHEFVKYLRQIFITVGQAYQKFPVNSYVYLFQVTFTVYYQSKQLDLIEYIKSLYQQYCKITYGYLNSQEAIVNYQHLVQDFIGLNKRIVTFHTRMFLQSGQAQSILKFSIHCLGSNLSRLTSGASQLFEIIFMIYWTPYWRAQYENSQKGQVLKYDSSNSALYEELKKFILPIVPSLINKMFKFLQSVPVQSSRDNCLDCLQAIALAFPEESELLWTENLSELGEDIITASQKLRLGDNFKMVSSPQLPVCVNAVQKIRKLFFTMTSRFMYRQSRAESLKINKKSEITTN